MGRSGLILLMCSLIFFLVVMPVHSNLSVFLSLFLFVASWITGWVFFLSFYFVGWVANVERMK